MNHSRALALVTASTLLASRPALAAPAAPLAAPAVAATGASSFHADLEVDPTAYILRGHSLHVGLGWGRLRVDLGAFGLAMPAAVTGNDDFSVAFYGYGAKLQVFPFAEQRGGFVGLDTAVNHPMVERVGSELASRRTEVTAGVHVGWRFVFAGDFYATPWLGVGYTLNGKPVTLGGSTYEPSRLVVFPAVHLGYRLR
jgi:hypothetical protein